MVTSGYDFPGHSILRICKMIFVRRKVLNMCFYYDKPKHEEAWEELFDGIISEMEEKAEQVGGNCVIGFRLELARMPDMGGFLALVAFGTAVYVEPN